MQIGVDGHVLLSPSDLTTWAACEWAFLRRLDAKLGRGGTPAGRARRHARAHGPAGGPARARLPRDPQADPRRRRVRPPGPAALRTQPQPQRDRPCATAPTSCTSRPSTRPRPPTSRGLHRLRGLHHPQRPRASTRSTTPSSPATPRSAPCCSSPPTPSRCRRTASRPGSRCTWSSATGRRPRTTSPTSRRCTARSAPSSQRVIAERIAADEPLQWGDPRYSAAADAPLPDPGRRAPRPGPRRGHAPRPAGEADPAGGADDRRPGGPHRGQCRACPARRRIGWCGRRASRSRRKTRRRNGATGRTSPASRRFEVLDPRALDAIPAPDPGDVFFDFEGDPLHTEDGVHWGLDYLFGLVDDRAEFTAFWAHTIRDERSCARDFLAFIEQPAAAVPGHAHLPLRGLRADAPAVARRPARRGRRSGRRPAARRRPGRPVPDRPQGPGRRQPQLLDQEARAAVHGRRTCARATSRTPPTASPPTSTRSRSSAPATPPRGSGCSTRSPTTTPTTAARPCACATGSCRCAPTTPTRRPRARARPAADPRRARAEPGVRRAGRAARATSTPSTAPPTRPRWRSPQPRSTTTAARPRPSGRTTSTACGTRSTSGPTPATSWSSSARPSSATGTRCRVPGRSRESSGCRGRSRPARRLRPGGTPHLVYDDPASAIGRLPGPRVEGRVGSRRDPRRAGRRRCRPRSCVLERLPVGGEPHHEFPVALAPSAPPRAKPQPEAIAEWGRLGPRRAAGDAARPRARPAATGAAARCARAGGRATTRSAAVVATLLGLDRSYLAIQGPPGTGKTYVGSNVVARLVREHGWRVGVVGQSHATSENFLDRRS